VVRGEELAQVTALEARDRFLLGVAERAREVARRLERGQLLALRGLAEEDGALDGAAQLAHVAGPGAAHQLGQERRRRCRVLAGELAEERRDQKRDVLGPLAQGRHLHAHRVEPVVEIGPERAAVHLLAQVAVGGGEEADVEARRLGRAHALDDALLERAQELGLHVEGQLADLVEEHGAAARGLERAGAGRVGAGERAPLVPEQLALDERGWDGAAVDDHERPAGALAALVEHLRHERLAGAGLALEQQRRLAGRDALEHGEHAPHERARAEEAPELLGGGERLHQLLGGDLDRERGATDLHPRARPQVRRLDAYAVDERAVGRAQVAHVHPERRRRDLAVVSRHQRVAEHEPVAFRRSDGERLGARRHLAVLVRLDAAHDADDEALELEPLLRRAARLRGGAGGGGGGGGGGDGGGLHDRR
jgi:hypothetical protein